MLKIENVKVVGWEHAIHGMRNPMNSWEKSDSECLFHALPNYSYDDPKAEEYTRYLDDYNLNLKLGPNDYTLMKKLRDGGPVHAKYRRMITVYLDITAPLYWWKEFDTYKVGTVANSCSTMHKIAAKEFTLDDFSIEHLHKRTNMFFSEIIDLLNYWRGIYLDGGMVDNYNGTARVYEKKDKDAWWQMIQLLPSSYNQKRTVMLNYEVLANIYQSRKDHKLDCWHTFCHWIEELPYSELITGYEEESH